ncbi:MAG TPA: glutamate--tRNA ligase [Casimicrobiaceae bacterium]|nr:glutamate--tRNA ligase [Casimicrobiaceae bacterium]
MSPVRTRFAPSPTGFLHLGGARTALFAWAFARHHGGKFILRIEDTDRERSTEQAIKAILDGMAWLGLDYDEGPHYQMQRLDRYKAVSDDMLARGLAYRCYMTPQELETLRAEQTRRGEKPRYDGRWRPENLQPGQTPPPGIAPVLRFKNPLQGTVAWDDQVKGRIEIANTELDDLVIMRRDAVPTYNFGVVVDDLDMSITHVIRGDDHVNNTPRQINMIRALGAEPPLYGHLPTVLGADGTKLSKRHGAVSVMQYADGGFLPDAMINFLARLGWGHGDDEIFSREQLVEWFDIKHVHPSPARFDADKLAWVNHEHLKRLSDDALGERLRPFLERAGLDVSRGPSPASVAALLRDRAATLAEMADAAHYFYAAPTDVIDVPNKFAKDMTDAVRAALPELLTVFESVDWTREAIGAAIKSVAAKHGLKPPQVMMAVRALVTGIPQTPAIDAVLALVGRERTIERIARSLAI